MEFLALLVALACFGLAGWMWRREGTPLYLLLLLAGQLGMVVIPLWNLLYNNPYRTDLAVFAEPFGMPLYTIQAFAASWHYTLPVLVVYYLYHARWWQMNYVIAVIVYAGFLLYHSLLEAAGLAFGIWEYTRDTALPIGISPALLFSLMAALISLALTYVVFMVRRYSWQSLLVFALPAPLLLSILVRGVIGAPFWMVQALNLADWAQVIGSTSTVILTLVGVHIFADALGKSAVELA